MVSPRLGSGFCFPRRSPDNRELASLSLAGLSDRAAEGLAELLPLLGCGEEAATLAFKGLAAEAQGAEAAALGRIAKEEQDHERLIAGLAASLPERRNDRDLMSAARRFHIKLGRATVGMQLAGIAATDSAVCLILSRVLRRGTAIAASPGAAALFRRIQSDEARHVHVSRALAIRSQPWAAMVEAGTLAREGLAALLAMRGDAFDAIGTDPDALIRAVAALPAGLYRQ